MPVFETERSQQADLLEVVEGYDGVSRLMRAGGKQIVVPVGFELLLDLSSCHSLLSWVHLVLAIVSVSRRSTS